MALFPLIPRVQRYNWGSPESLPRIFGLPNPDGTPMAEIWMGAHPAAPSLIRETRDVAIAEVADAAEERSLLELIEADPGHAVGVRNAAAYGARLPFLFKMLSAARGLSVQAHPGRDEAARGYAREERLQISTTDPRRSYKDRNHKPELMCAVTEFWALRGFRPLSEIAEEFGGNRWPLPAEVTELLHTGPEEAALSRLLRTLLSAEGSFRDRLVETALARAEAMKRDADETGWEHGPRAYREPRFYWVSELARQFPGDPGILAPLYLNCFCLQPGEATSLDPGVLHAYLSGTGLEVMANSDNVLRGGLTSKHVDVEELLRVVRFSGEPPYSIQPEPVDSTPGTGHREYAYRSPAPEFELRRIEIAADSGVEMVSSGGPEILLCTEGAVEISDLASDEPYIGGIAGSRTVLLHRGYSTFVPAATKELRITGRGVLFRARTPEPPSQAGVETAPEPRSRQAPQFGPQSRPERPNGES